jgi:glutathione synthase/RimK-type ligase-like ATP-grasp enzyme
MKKFVRIRTKNSTSRPLRRSILTDHWAVCRLGSLTPTNEIFNRTGVIEVNTVEAIQNSRSKIRMKKCFESGKVPQATWWQSLDGLNLVELPYPLVAKKTFGFQGRGMTYIEDHTALKSWLKTHSLDGSWIIEHFYNYSKEYRIHVGTKVGAFLSWRKLRRKDAEDRWYFNSTNSVWVGEAHEHFDKPLCWKEMEDAAIKALKSTKLDIGAVDIRVQSNRHAKPAFIVCEINSAPALGDDGIEEYKKVIASIIKYKAHE